MYLIALRFRSVVCKRGIRIRARQTCCGKDRQAMWRAQLSVWRRANTRGAVAFVLVTRCSLLGIKGCCWCPKWNIFWSKDRQLKAALLAGRMMAAQKWPVVFHLL